LNSKAGNLFGQPVVDLFDVQPFQSEKKPISFVVAAREKYLRRQVELAQASELALQAIDISEFALRNLTQLFTEEERGTAILLLQAQGGLLIIARDGVLYLTRSLTIGMNELLPLADGNLEALTEQLDSIVLEVQRSFDYCESTFHLPMVSRMLVAQTGREVSAVLSYLDDYLSTKVEPLSFAEVLEVPADIDQLELNSGLLAIGGALRQGAN
jgi:MSHA biogenesis protein MshI